MTAPSSWLLRFDHALRAGATALDVACGSGRHVRLLAARGMRVTAVDRDAQALAALEDVADVLQADLEANPWPLPGRQFDLVLVTNYLWRPLFDSLRNAVAPGGWLICETFAQGQQSIGRPSRSAFLLQPGELLSLCAGLRVVAFEDGFEPGDPSRGVNPRFVQRVAAVRAPQGGAEPHPRYPLQPCSTGSP